MFDVKLKEHWLTEKAKSQGVDLHICELVLRHARTEDCLHHAMIKTLHDAISGCFTWYRTPEGDRFWHAIYLGQAVRPLLSNSASSMCAHALFIDFKEFE